MSIQTNVPSYILGNSPSSEYRLELLDELTGPQFVEALGVLPKRKMRILILGCGSGHLEARLSTVFSDSSFIGIDFSAQRIEEARARTGTLKVSNTFHYMQADLTTLSVKDLACDILISRFVLSHLSNPLKNLMKFLPVVKPGGFVCLQEVASDGSEYFCNPSNLGYRLFRDIVEKQIKVQDSCFEIGFHLLTELTKCSKVHHCYISQQILRGARHKSILRLGIEEAKDSIPDQTLKDRIAEGIGSLRQFEEDECAFGLYTRSLAVIAQIPG